MSMRKTIFGIMIAATVSAVIPSASFAHDGRGWHRGHDRRDDDRRYYGRNDHRDRGYYRGGYDRRPDYRGSRYSCRSGGTTGLLVGGVAGALLGRSIDRYGDRTPGTIIGAGAGALLGREVERGSRC